jgi:hypothetical protein
MANIVLDIVLIGAFAAFAIRSRRRRRTAPPEMEHGAQQTRIAVSVRRESPAKARTQPVTPPMAPATPVRRPDYLLGGRATGAADRVAATMDMMSGPGLCTPRDG